MNLAELRLRFEYLVDDDNTDQTQLDEILNEAYDTINLSRFWNYTLTTDTSETIVNGTTSYDLPDDFAFLHDDEVYTYDSSEDRYTRFQVIEYRDRIRYNNTSGYVYISPKDSKINFTSSEDTKTYAGETLYIPYHYQPDELSAVGDTPVFNRAYHKLIALEAAKYFWYNDQQTDGSWDSKMQAEYDRVMKKMIDWDENFKVQTDGDFMPQDSWIPQAS